MERIKNKIEVVYLILKLSYNIIGSDDIMYVYR